MHQDLIFLPALAQMLLILVMYVALQRAKQRAVRNGEVDEARRALHEDAWPDYVRQINNNIRNQFELPVLFYALCLMLWALQAAGLAAQLLAWGFVLSRVAHATVHAGSNRVPIRRRWFTLGVLLIFALMGLAAGSVVMRSLTA